MANTTTSTLPSPRSFTIGLNEVLNFAYDAFCSNKLQFMLTALAMAVGTASVILVATIGLTGKQYILRQLQSIGTNMIYADYQGGAQRIDSTPDPMTVEDVQAVREQVSSVVAASPTVALGDRINVGAGKQSDILVLGVDPDYTRVRNLKVLAGRFFDSEDSAGRNKVAVITEKLAQKLFGRDPASGGPDHQAERRASVHDRGRVQGERGHVRAIRHSGRDHADPVHGQPLLHAHGGGVSDLFFGGQRAGRDPGHGGDQARPAVAASSRVGLQRAEPDAASHGGGKLPTH